MLHYAQGQATYGLHWSDFNLYKLEDTNPLLNDIRCFLLSPLHTFQNMQTEYAVSPGFDIAAYVYHSKTLHDGTEIYCFSKELLAYLETCVAFCPYYRADNPRATASMDKYYKSALESYSDILYANLHA